MKIAFILLPLMTTPIQLFLLIKNFEEIRKIKQHASVITCATDQNYRMHELEENLWIIWPKFLLGAGINPSGH